MDAIQIKTLTVNIQANGIIRNSDGWIIGQIDENVDFQKLDKTNPYKALDGEQ